MKLRAIVSAALIIGAFSAQAATQGAAAASGTNANTEAAMTALFGDPVIVKGKGFEIKSSELNKVLSGAKANAAASNQRLPEDFAVSIMDQLISIRVLLQSATEADKAAGQIEADIQYTNLLSRFVSPEAFERQLKAVDMTVAELRSKALDEAVAKSALKRELNISVSDEDAKDFYAKHPADFEQPEKVHARHILLMTIDPSTRTPLSTNTVAAKRKQIEDLRKQILAGADFSVLAKQYSEDPGSKENGGELPLFSRGEMVPEFEAAAFALGTNQVSEVVTTQFGYHLIKVLEKVPAKKIEYATASTDIKDFLSRSKIAKAAPAFVNKLRADQQVEILDAKLKAMDQQMQASQAAAAASAGAAGK